MRELVTTSAFRKDLKRLSRSPHCGLPELRAVI